MLGIGEIIVFVSMGIVLLSWRRIHQIGGSLGKSIHVFRKALKGESDRPLRDINGPPKDTHTT